MNTDTWQKKREKIDFQHEYAEALRDYAMDGGEAVLGRAYELGRRAIAEPKALLESGSRHRQVLKELFQNSVDRGSPGQLVQISCDFLSECVSPYEMAQRGFQDAVKALRQLNETLEEEVKRLAYSVADEAGQLLVAVHLALANRALERPPGRKEQVREIEGLLNEVEKHLRRYSHELRPTILDDLGWIPAIRFLAEGISNRAGLPIHIEATVSGRLPSPVETALYRTVQEGLTNAVKHAKARNVWIRAWKERLALCCSIRDDGAGFDSQHVQREAGRKGLGLIAMQERMSAIGGTLRVESCPGRGTELSVRVPLEVGHANTRRARG